MLRSMKNREGFTLVELLIVVAIIGILAAIAIPQFAAYREKAYCSAIKSDLANLAVSEEAYFTDNDSYKTVTLSGGTTDTDLDFTPSSGVTIVVASSDTRTEWSATGTHTNCGGGGTIYTWDSDAGGLQ